MAYIRHLESLVDFFQQHFFFCFYSSSRRYITKIDHAVVAALVNWPEFLRALTVKQGAL
jgi:hypothetical protein